MQMQYKTIIYDNNKNNKLFKCVGHYGNIWLYLWFLVCSLSEDHPQSFALPCFTPFSKSGSLRVHLMINVFGLVWGAAKQGFVVRDKSACLFAPLRRSPDLFYPRKCDKMANGCGTVHFVLVLSEGLFTDFTTALFLEDTTRKGKSFCWSQLNIC